MILDPQNLVLLTVTGVAAGIVNGVAGGGSLLSFPVLLALGVPAVAANVTSTVGIWPGYLGGSAGFRDEIAQQRDRLRQLAPATGIGSLGGIALLLTTPSQAFSHLAPYLILLACALFALQPRLALHLQHGRPEDGLPPLVLQLAVTLAAAYGSYFGAGLGVLLLGVLGLALPDNLNRVNGLRSAMALSINTLAAVAFIVLAGVRWDAVAVMAPASLIGGWVGAQLARRMPAGVLRGSVITIGLIAAGRLLI